MAIEGLEDELLELTRRVVLFEFNDCFTRDAWRRRAHMFLSNHEKVSEFHAICDETNNSDDILDANQFVADVYCKEAGDKNFTHVHINIKPSGRG